MQELNEPSDSKLVKKRPVGLLVLIAVGGIAIMGVMLYFWRSSTFVDYNYTLMMSAKAINLTCPQVSHETTRLDSVSAKRDRVFTHYFTFLKIRKGESDSTLCDRWRDKMQITTGEVHPQFGENGVTVVYKSRDMDGAELCDITLLPKDYYKPGN